MAEFFFEKDGNWNIKNVTKPEFVLILLDPIPIENDLRNAYINYYTHYDEEKSETLKQRFFNEIKEGYWADRYGYQKGKVSLWNKIFGKLIYLHPGKRSEVDFDIYYLQAQRGAKLLEIGCGSGKNLKRLQDLGWDVEGVDFDSSAVKNAESKGLKVHLGVVEDISYPDDSFDVIVLCHVIEHVYDPRQVMRECYRILKPKGRLVIFTPNNQSMAIRLFKSSCLSIYPPRHLRVFSMLSLISLAEGTGFQIKEAMTTMRGADVVFYTSRSIKNAGKCDLGETKPPVAKAWASGLQLLEWIALKANSNLGEENYLVAIK